MGGARERVSEKGADMLHNIILENGRFLSEDENEEEDEDDSSLPDAGHD